MDKDVIYMYTHIYNGYIHTHTHTHTHTYGILLSPKKNKILSFSARDLDNMLSAISQTEKEKYCMILCGI